MSNEAWVTIGVTVLVLYFLAKEIAPTDMVFMGAIVLLCVLGILNPAEAFGGFVNNAVLMVGGLLIVAAGLRETGVMDAIGHRFLSPIKTEVGALLCLAVFCTTKSAFLNNTSTVALLIPVVLDWCRKNNVAPSKLLIPLSFLTIMGGCCTLIGTSTNLVVDGLMRKANMQPMSMFEIAWVGVPCALLGLVYLLTIGRRLLPERKDLIEQLGDSRREYLVEMLVQPTCRLVGQTVEVSGLRNLPGLFLFEIDRGGAIIGPVSPDDVIQSGDRLTFTGVVSTIVDLKKIPGLLPAEDASFEVSTTAARQNRRLVEAVVSQSSPLVGQTVREAGFRSRYNAAIVAIHRNGERVRTKIGEVKLAPGDTLLMQTGSHFVQSHRNNPDFYLVSDVDNSVPLRHDRWWVAVLILIGMIVVMTAKLMDPMLTAFVAAGLMMASGCLSTSDARQAIDWSVLISIGASFGLGTALEKTGAAEYLSLGMVEFTQPFGPYATLAAIYFMTMVLNELITNNGAAVLAFPFAINAAALSHCNPRPFLMAVTLAASFAFASPVGYQTHMMVYGPGGYRFSDFVKVGLPLNLLFWVASVVLIPLIWPFAAAP